MKVGEVERLIETLGETEARRLYPEIETEIETLMSRSSRLYDCLSRKYSILSPLNDRLSIKYSNPLKLELDNMKFEDTVSTSKENLEKWEKKTVRRNIDYSVAMFERLQRASERTNLSLQSIVKAALLEWLERHGL